MVFYYISTKFLYGDFCVTNIHIENISVLLLLSSMLVNSQACLKTLGGQRKILCPPWRKGHMMMEAEDGMANDH